MKTLFKRDLDKLPLSIWLETDLGKVKKLYPYYQLLRSEVHSALWLITEYEGVKFSLELSLLASLCLIFFCLQVQVCCSRLIAYSFSAFHHGVHQGIICTAWDKHMVEPFPPVPALGTQQSFVLRFRLWRGLYLCRMPSLTTVNSCPGVLFKAFWCVISERRDGCSFFSPPHLPFLSHL